MKTGDIVFVFKTYNLLSENLVDLLLNKKYNVAKVYAQLDRKEGSKFYYAEDLNNKVDGQMVKYCSSEFTKLASNVHLFILKTDVIDFLRTLSIKDPEKASLANDLINDIEEIR